MKKYKLKKDLPLAKAGTIVKIEDAPVKSNVKLIFDAGSTKHPLCVILDNQTSEWLEEIPEPKSIWNIKKQDEYYTIINGIIYQYDWSDSPNDKRILEDGNIFLTREEAEKDLEKRKAIGRIKKYCWENDIEIVDNSYKKNNKNFKVEICYRMECGMFKTNSYYENVYAQEFVFKNGASAEKVIKNCEDDLKIIFNV